MQIPQYSSIFQSNIRLLAFLLAFLFAFSGAQRVCAAPFLPLAPDVQIHQEQLALARAALDAKRQGKSHIAHAALVRLQEAVARGLATGHPGFNDTVLLFVRGLVEENIELLQRLLLAVPGEVLPDDLRALTSLSDAKQLLEAKRRNALLKESQLWAQPVPPLPEAEKDRCFWEAHGYAVAAGGTRRLLLPVRDQYETLRKFCVEKGAFTLVPVDTHPPRTSSEASLKPEHAPRAPHAHVGLLAHWHVFRGTGLAQSHWHSPHLQDGLVLVPSVFGQRQAWLLRLGGGPLTEKKQAGTATKGFQKTAKTGAMLSLGVAVDALELAQKFSLTSSFPCCTGLGRVLVLELGGELLAVAADANELWSDSSRWVGLGQIATGVQWGVAARTRAAFLLYGQMSGVQPRDWAGVGLQIRLSQAIEP